MTPRALAPALLCSALVACAASRPRLEDLAPAEGFVEVLPRSAEVELDGAAAGPGARTIPVRDPARVHRIRAVAAGFEPGEIEVRGEQLAGARVGLVLRPEGFGAARPLELDEPKGLASAAALLLRAGRAREATEYAARAAELAPDAPLPQRVLGDAWLRLGDRERAARGYAGYLAHAPPDAPERREVERRLSELRGDVDLSGGRR